MAEFLFFVAAAGAIAGAMGVIASKNPFYNVLFLVCHLISLAALFLLLRAEFIAAVQVVVYAGAVMVLYVFVVAYVGGSAEPMRRPFAPGLRTLSVLFATVLLVELWIALLGTGLKGIDSEGAAFDPDYGTPEQIGRALLTKFLLPFELASLLLLVAAVGAVVLARRRRGVGIEDDDVPVYSAMDVLKPRPLGTGTMREAVSGLPEHASDDEDDEPRELPAGGKTGGGW